MCSKTHFFSYLIVITEVFMPYFFEENKRIISWASILEDEAIVQIKNMSKMPFLFKHVAVMPDAHAGKGSTVGTVIATKGAIIPAAIGVDIGCGMMAQKLPFKISDIENISILRNSIERIIPVGFSSHNNHDHLTQDIFNELAFEAPDYLYSHNDEFDKSLCQIGTLGGGNHFIEICYDEENNAWVMLHSGSRHIGNLLAKISIDKAKKIMEQYFINLEDPDLAYLVEGSAEFHEYIKSMLWAQKYAAINRIMMMRSILTQISLHIFKEDKSFDWPIKNLSINCHHNFTQLENHFNKNVWITRKGAVSARRGEYGIIPGSMGSYSYIVTGKGNKNSFSSCSHGAGRIMSRSKARKIFTQEDLIQQTLGVDCRKDSAIIDEIPSAYKDIDIVMNDQIDLVDVIYKLKQIMCIKG